MKQHIKTVKEYNERRAKELNARFEALDEVVKAAERYELLRTLNVTEFKRLFMICNIGTSRFDDEVDKLIEARK